MRITKAYLTQEAAALEAEKSATCEAVFAVYARVRALLSPEDFALLERGLELEGRIKEVEELRFL